MELVFGSFGLDFNKKMKLDLFQAFASIKNNFQIMEKCIETIDQPGFW